jgi:uncharacterized membrane protein YeaQ/YmgE (transglycosylase-associated protein family)
LKFKATFLFQGRSHKSRHKTTHWKEESMFIIWWVIVGLIAGWLTGKIMSGGGYGALMDMVIGIVGAIVGGFIMRAVGFAGSGGMI